jgi:hypothetical protein
MGIVSEELGGVRELVDALRAVQVEHGLDATMVLTNGHITIRFTGVQAPIGTLEDQDGNTVAINAP